VENQRPLHLTVQRPFDCVGRFGMPSAGVAGGSRGCSLLTPKENQKSASDFDALEPRKRGCSPLLTPKKWATPEKTEDSRLFGVKIF
jgi:hypothetical protein